MKGKNDTIAERGSEDPIDILADDIVGIVEQHCKRLDRTGCSEQIAKTLRQGAHELWETSADDVTIQQLKAQLAALQLAYERLGEFYEGQKRQLAEMESLVLAAKGEKS